MPSGRETDQTYFTAQGACTAYTIGTKKHSRPCLSYLTLLDRANVIRLIEISVPVGKTAINRPRQDSLTYSV